MWGKNDISTYLDDECKLSEDETYYGEPRTHIECNLYKDHKQDHSIVAQAFFPGHTSNANDSCKNEQLNIA